MEEDAVEDLCIGILPLDEGFICCYLDLIRGVDADVRWEDVPSEKSLLDVTKEF